MTNKKTCKFFRKFLPKKDQIRLCTGQSCMMAENASYRWSHVDCPKCKKLRYIRA